MLINAKTITSLILFFFLLVEEKWPISHRRMALSLFHNGLLLSLICIGIQGLKLINHCPGSNDQTIDNIQRTVRVYYE